MLVDVIELRLGEHPRDRADVLATVPVRGEINVDRFWTHGNVDRAPVNADLRPMQLETLYSARMEYWKGLDIKLSGYQRQRPPGSKEPHRYPQEWWCRIVLDPSVPPMSPLERKRLRLAAARVVKERGAGA